MPQDEVVEVMAKRFLEKLPLNFDLERVQSQWPTLYEDSMNTVNWLNVPAMSPECAPQCALNVPQMCPQCPPNVPSMSPNVPSMYSMFPECSFNVSRMCPHVSQTFPEYAQCSFNVPAANVPTVSVLSMFPLCSPNVPQMCPDIFLPVPSTPRESSLNVSYMSDACSLNIPLVLTAGAAPGADPLQPPAVCGEPLSAKHPQRPKQGFPQLKLNVPSRFPNVPCMFPNVP
jgi:hypothetical protein